MNWAPVSSIQLRLGWDAPLDTYLDSLVCSGGSTNLG